MSLITQPILVPFGGSAVGQAANLKYSIYDSTGTLQVNASNSGVSELTDGTGAGSGTYLINASINTQWLPARVHVIITGVAGLSYDTVLPSTSSSSGTVGTANAPSVPTGLTVTNRGDGQPAISWNANPESNIMYYQLIRQWLRREVYHATGTSTQDQNIHPGVTVSYAVAAINTSGQASSLSTAVTYTVPTGTYADPTWIGSQPATIPIPPNWIGPPAY